MIGSILKAIGGVLFPKEKVKRIIVAVIIAAAALAAGTNAEEIKKLVADAPVIEIKQ